MALEITGNIQLDNGITLSSAYGRTDYRMNDKSDSMVISVRYWVDKTSYDDGLSDIITQINTKGRYPYNRDTDGADVLDYTNQVIKTELEAQGYSVVITEL